MCRVWTKLTRPVCELRPGHPEAPAVGVRGLWQKGWPPTTNVSRQPESSTPAPPAAMPGAEALPHHSVSVFSLIATSSPAAPSETLGWRIDAGSGKLKLLNGSSDGVTQTSSVTTALRGGATSSSGANSRLEVNPNPPKDTDGQT